MTNRERKQQPVANRLLLIEDVDDLGRSGDIVKVKPGYARNYLIPRKKGVVADRNAMRIQSRLQEKRAQQASLDREISDQIAGQVHGITQTIHVKVDPDNNMYGSVTSAEIVEVLSGAGITIEKKAFQLPHGIRKIGLHTIEVRLKEGVKCNFKLKVLPEGMDELPEEPVKEEEVVEVVEVVQEEGVQEEPAVEEASDNAEEA